MIAIACDHAGFDLKHDIMAHLDSLGRSYKDFGTYSGESCNYPEFASLAARAVSSGSYETGILICGTGIGMSIAANKIAGIRAALCGDLLSAELTRLHNNANMLVLGARIVEKKLALEIIDMFLKTGFEGVNGGRHAERVQMLADLEAGWEISLNKFKLN